MLKNVYFKTLAKHFSKWFDDGCKNLVNTLKKGEADLWISSGSLEHWENAIRFALNTCGYIIWGKGVEDLSSLELPKKSRSFTSIWPMFDNYLKMHRDGASPIINIFYASNVGILGAGIFTLLVLDINTLFWKEEVDNGKLVFPVRWIAKVFWLHDSVRANPYNGSAWKGIQPPKNTPVQSGLQHITNPELVKSLISILLEHKDEFAQTLQFFEKVCEKPIPFVETATKPSHEHVTAVELVGSCVIDVGNEIDTIRRSILNEFIIDENIVDWILSLLLYSCKNVLLVGKPGTGKTTLAKRVAEHLKFKPMIFTAHAHWSRHDVIGGPMLSSNGEVIWRSGALIKALAEHFKAKAEGLRGAWLIIDEINRADVDKAFGEFFTIFSSSDASEWVIPLHLIKEISEYADSGRADEDAKTFLKYICREEGREWVLRGGCRVPQDFRVIATMNYVDVANLFTVGEAFARRFARIVINYTSTREEIEKEVMWFIDNRLSKILDKSDLEDLRKVVTDTSLIDVIKGLRGVQRLAFGPAHTYNVLQNILGYLKFRKRADDIKRVVKEAIEATLTLNPLWDEELKKKVDEVLEILRS